MIVDPTMRSVENLDEFNASSTLIYQYFYPSLVTFEESKIQNVIYVYTTNDSYVVLDVPANFDRDLAYLLRCDYADQFVKSPRNFDDKGKLIFNKLVGGFEGMTNNYLVDQNFPLKSELKFMVEAFRESGLREHEKRRMMAASAKRVVKEEKNFVMFGDMIFPFEVLLGGVTLGFLMLLGELIWWRIKAARLRRVRSMRRIAFAEFKI